ncbi:hypothetical protein [Haladaptatus caseinilyticus]|uniref:hypothetical protein n=1 Tax=Haladaptatus caseinilyticus TaxID=2993314 RepID=UPI00224A7A4C|nr:hypothetical protein [Haladaptatus caseinilyticus]
MNGTRIGLWLVVVGTLALYPAIQFGRELGATNEIILLYGAVLAVGFGIALWGLSVVRTLSTEWMT